MFCREKTEIADFRSDYAGRSDFCDLFEREMQPFYLLAFLLTANHKNAEQVFALTLEQALREQSVFKDWAHTWVKRSLIKNAIDIVSPDLTRNGERQLWGASQPGTVGENEIDAVTLLAPLQRFVFVMSILEHYSPWECSVLLGCSVLKVVRSRIQALRRLPAAVEGLPQREVRITPLAELLA
jgi:DNA-directed RNA polymerase specialized sigma24 family protein